MQLLGASAVQALGICPARLDSCESGSTQRAMDDGGLDPSGNKLFGMMNVESLVSAVGHGFCSFPSPVRGNLVVQAQVQLLGARGADPMHLGGKRACCETACLHVCGRARAWAAWPRKSRGAATKGGHVGGRNGGPISGKTAAFPSHCAQLHGTRAHQWW